MATQNKFTANLTLPESGIKGKRASILASSAETAHNDLISRLTKEYNTLELTLENLNDLSPDSTTSLKVGGDDFDAEVWVQKMQDTKIALLNKKIELRVAKETHQEWFAVEAPNFEDKA